jgi:hypothetical protein
MHRITPKLTEHVIWRVASVLELTEHVIWRVASVLAANTILRSEIAACFPLFSRQLSNNMGIQWAGTLLGTIALPMVPIPLLFREYGAYLRQKSSNLYSSPSYIAPVVHGETNYLAPYSHSKQFLASGEDFRWDNVTICTCYDGSRITRPESTFSWSTPDNSRSFTHNSVWNSGLELEVLR